VFFDVSTYEDYGQLSGNTLDALRGGDRVGEGEVARKKNAADFVLWKPELDGVGWDAPFGRGRPGWHIECSAMAKATLTEGIEGDVIDIHCGGVEKFANYWVHNEFLNMGSEKMSKSLGNVTLVHDLLKEWDGEVIRLALLKAHYRSELSWSEDLLKESKAQLDGWYKMLMNLKNQDIADAFFKLDETGFNFLVEEDINTPIYISRISALVRMAITGDLIDNISAGAIKPTANLLGLLQKDPEEWFGGGISDADKALAEEYDVVRAKAMEAKQAGDKAAMGEAFKKSDAIRDQISAKGLVLETSADGKSSLRKA